jgi:hypothetical protein
MAIHYYYYFTLAFCFAELGQEEEARAAVTKILQLQPSASLEWVQKPVPYANPADLERLVAGLRKAGLRRVKNEELRMKNEKGYRLEAEG